MTTRVYEAPAPQTAAAVGPRRILLSPFGWYTRYVLRGYAHYIFVVTIALICVALSIDLSQRTGQLLATSPGLSNADTLGRIAWYAALRGADLTTQLFPLACFLGVLWFEAAQTHSRERVMIWNSGRSPLQCLMPVLILGVFAGGVELVLERYVRPAAIKAQADGRLGDYGRMFDRRLSANRHWIAAGDDLVHARIEYGPPAALHDVMIYRHAPGGDLMEVITARLAEPGHAPNRWLLRDGGRWPVSGAKRPDGGASETQAERTTPAAGSDRREEIDLHVDPLWLSNYRIYARFLPQDVLQTLASNSGGRYATTDYQTWLHFRNAQALYPGSMALLAASLALLLMAHGLSIGALVTLAFAGYAGHIAVKACLLLGEHGYLPPLVAAWFSPASIISVSLAALILARWRNLGPQRVALRAR
jgi:lipopolysaccharide export system permease protein